MFLPANSKLVTTEQATGGSDIVCFIIENYLALFSEENEYCLGDESEILVNDEHGEDSDSGADQVIYKYGEEVDEQGDSEKESEPMTPDFLLSPVGGREPVFSHSDSSLNTNDSDELKMAINKLNIPSIALNSSTTGSKSSPNSPMIGRRKKVEKSLSTDNGKMLSDWSDQEGNDNENFQRRLLRQPRSRRMLSSTTTSAELIEHKRHIASSNTSITSGETGVSPSSSSNSLPSSATLVPQKHVISQPIIQHFSTEYRPTPNVIFDAIDRRRQPAAPSYEEHIQRTQPKQRIVKSTSKRQPVVAHTTIVQHQSSPVTRPKRVSHEEKMHDILIHQTSPQSSMSESNSQHSISSLSSNEESKRTSTLSRKPRVKKDEKPRMLSPKQSKLSMEDMFFPKENGESAIEASSKKKMITKEEDFMMQELLNNLQEGVTPIDNEDKNMADTLQQQEQQLGDNTIEDTFNSIMDSLQHNVQLNGRIATRQASITTKERTSIAVVENKKTPPPTAPKPTLSRNSSSSSTNKDLERDEEMRSLHTMISTLTEGQLEDDDTVFTSCNSTNHHDSNKPSQSPFTLTLKHSRKSPQNSESDECKSQSSLALEKTLLTKAPKKIDQLTLKPNERREDQLPARQMTHREFRKTNRRLKSEIRNAFNEGKFNIQTNKDRPSSESTTHTTRTVGFNNYFKEHTIKNTELRNTDGLQQQQNKENMMSPLNFVSLLEASRQRYSETNNNTTNLKKDTAVEDGLLPRDNRAHNDNIAFAQIMSQAESYV